MLSRFPWFTHYASRKLEWLISIYTMWFGVMLMLPMHSMSSASFIGALVLFGEREWGAIYAFVGVLHCYALHINGRAPWTPFARLLALFLNANAFLAMSLSLVPANPWGTGVMTYGFLAIGFCGAALYSAAQDCGREIKIWRAARNAKS